MLEVGKWLLAIVCVELFLVLQIYFVDWVLNLKEQFEYWSEADDSELFDHKEYDVTVYRIDGVYHGKTTAGSPEGAKDLISEQARRGKLGYDEPEQRTLVEARESRTTGQE